MIHAGGILMLIIFALSVPLAKPKERMLVLGFDCRQLNDIQDRLLRETILKEFLDKGFDIVPVMEIESLFYGSGIRQIRRLKSAVIKGICDDLGAGYACYGTITPENGARDGMIMPGKNYICAVTYYQKEGNRFHELKLTVQGKESLLEYFRAVAAQVVVGFDKLRS